MKKTAKIIICWYAFLFALLFFTSCEIQKKAFKDKTNTETQNDIVRESTEVTQEKREGGNLHTGIIPESERARDENGDIKELIQTLKDGGLTKTIYYKPDGTVDVDCTADEIWIRIEKRLNERDTSTSEINSKVKDKEKTEKLSSSIVLYGFLGIGFIIMIVAFFGFRYLKSIIRV